MLSSTVPRLSAEDRKAVEESTTHPTKLEINMSIVTPVYSTLFYCLYDEQSPKTRRFPHYSVFRAVDSRDVCQKPTESPRIHDFAVIWDDDHDTRIIPVLEEILMAGLLPGIQFIGEHKGTLTIILAARTYSEIDLTAFTNKVEKLSAAAQDYWQVEVGQFDRTEGNLKVQHQCDFQSLFGGYDADFAYAFAIDGMWSLGTKAWRSVDEARSKILNEPFWGTPSYDRLYVDLRKPRASAASAVPADFTFGDATKGGGATVLPPLPKP